ncbi:VPLPA-CTERM sorting domain-containing protein [Rubrimonas cliftonensis]|uniref:VPLPA-CTERM protein sorting domain-containing protein n=1 Tax=Rubrimonas cliftonensis TaxID=89524 RepID=A0A1H3YW43_9RHOB|nr:VPLPA-CTERM sorting domain-containing protein [Rubrimonas cliftonensis]SEA15640.1 VPLPA-CTERM protein sorting domain-containing protein [Rubrimonas cliftonensis]
MVSVSHAAAAAAVVSMSLAFATSAGAALAPAFVYTGSVGVSTDGFGSTSGVGTISASAPSGSTVIAAYLYTSTYDEVGFSTVAPTTVTLDGDAVTYTQSIQNPSYSRLTAHRADVTSTVKPVIDGSAGGVYDFAYNENNAGVENGRTGIDGSALVVVYDNPALSDRTVAVLDGFSDIAGDTFDVTFGVPLDPTAPGFNLEMFLGIGYSCCNQASNITVNGTLISRNSGNFDDGLQQANGSLITMGSFDDAPSAFLPSYAADTERYDLAPYVNAGDTLLSVDTLNPSVNDNIFVAVLDLTGTASVVNPDVPTDPTVPPIPLPASMWLLVSGIAMAAGVARRRAC